MTPVIRFGIHRFDVDTATLWRGRDEVRLTPKAADVLKLLVQRAGTPVSKAALFASVWQDTIVSDEALTTCIQELRRALADDAKRPRFIETRHRRGYRFVAPIEAAIALNGEIAAGPPLESAMSPGLMAVAVLPFADMSPGRDQDYLCEGIAEELISALTNVMHVRVIARAASFQFRSMGVDVRSVGQQLGVGVLVGGSVRKAENRLRVTVQLVDVITGYQRWSRRFDRTLDDVFALQDEIAQLVATSLTDLGCSPPQPGAYLSLSETTRTVQ
jgi:TolB-like protein